MTECFILPSSVHAALQQRADGPAADSHLLLHHTIPPSISLPSFGLAVQRPSTAVFTCYLAAHSLHSGKHNCSYHSYRIKVRKVKGKLQNWTQDRAYSHMLVQNTKQQLHLFDGYQSMTFAWKMKHSFFACTAEIIHFCLQQIWP